MSDVTTEAGRPLEEREGPSNATVCVVCDYSKAAHDMRLDGPCERYVPKERTPSVDQPRNGITEDVTLTGSAGGAPSPEFSQAPGLSGEVGAWLASRPLAERLAVKWADHEGVGRPSALELGTFANDARFFLRAIADAESEHVFHFQSHPAGVDSYRLGFIAGVRAVTDHMRQEADRS